MNLTNQIQALEYTNKRLTQPELANKDQVIILFDLNQFFLID